MKKKSKSIEEQLKELKNIELKYKTLLNTIPSLAWFTDANSIYKDVNEAFKIHSGKELEDIIGLSHEDVWTKKIGNECIENDIKTINKKETIAFKEIVAGKRGYRTYTIHRSPVIDEHGKVIGIIAVSNDTTSIKNRDTQIQTILENIPFKVWLRDKEGYYINSNSEFASGRNTTVNGLIGKNINEFYNEEELNEIYKEDKSVIENHKTIKFVKRVNHKTNKNKRVLEVYKTPVFDIGGRLIGIVGIIIDVTKTQETKDMIKKQAYTDSQTGLLNRRALYEYVKHRFNGNQITIMILDIDNFKYINDEYGHIIGDEVLESVCDTLKRCCPKDFLFRFGGDEFIIISNYKMTNERIKEKANKILEKIGEKRIKNERINVSVGVAICNCNRDKCEVKNCEKRCKSGECKLISKADVALYKAKEYGKNQAVIYSQGLEEELNLRISIEHDLQNAVENNEIELYYQPQYKIDKTLVGFEALFRWKNKKYNNVRVEEIISIMEKSNLITSIGNEVIKQASMFAKKINKNRQNKIVVSFNVSPLQIMDKEFIKNVNKALIDAKLESIEDVKLLGIEITENILLDNIDQNIEKIKQLKEVGITIALDDFGTGYSSLNYLVKLPLSTTKIDRSFIAGMENSEEYAKLVKLMIEGSHSLGLKVIAEGVENENQLEMLKEMGIDYIQGYLFSKPLKEEEALQCVQR
ncbi:MAG: sensor domain-containing protein [Peptostreptococcaceae bacterium]